MKNVRTMRLALAGVALLCLFAPTSFAAAGGSAPEATAIALSAVTLDVGLHQDLSVVVPEVNVLHVSEVPEVTVAGVQYRPKGSTPPKTSGYKHPTGPQTVTQIYGGRLDPDGHTDGQFLMGLRGGPMLNSRVQLGMLFEWAHDSEYNSSNSAVVPGPGGLPVTTLYDYSGAEADLFPLMGFMQLFLFNEKRFIVPYVGAAGGYQWLNLTAYDRNGYYYDATFGGWGWQAWGGAALRMSDNVRLTGEAFYNGGELSRDIQDPIGGWSNHETVSVYGLGARFGLALGF